MSFSFFSLWHLSFFLPACSIHPSASQELSIFHVSKFLVRKKSNHRGQPLKCQPHSPCLCLSYIWLPHPQGGNLGAIIRLDDSWPSHGCLDQERTLYPNCQSDSDSLKNFKFDPKLSPFSQHTWGSWPQRLVCESVFVHVSDGGVHCSLTEDLFVPQWTLLARGEEAEKGGVSWGEDVFSLQVALFRNSSPNLPRKKPVRGLVTPGLKSPPVFLCTQSSSASPLDKPATSDCVPSVVPTLGSRRRWGAHALSWGTGKPWVCPLPTPLLIVRDWEPASVSTAPRLLIPPSHLGLPCLLPYWYLRWISKTNAHEPCKQGLGCQTSLSFRHSSTWSSSIEFPSLNFGEDTSPESRVSLVKPYLFSPKEKSSS